jgi:hypothetical protein
MSEPQAKSVSSADIGRRPILCPMQEDSPGQNRTVQNCKSVQSPRRKIIHRTSPRSNSRFRVRKQRNARFSISAVNRRFKISQSTASARNAFRSFTYSRSTQSISSPQHPVGPAEAARWFRARATASRALDTSGITAPPPARIRLFRLNLHTLFTPFERHDRNKA